jgi:cysteine desulfurase
MSAYLDHAASTPLRPEAFEAMVPYLRDEYANPSGAHTLARRARQAIDESRDVVAEIVGAAPGDVVFTSGGTEADNLAVFGVHDRVGGMVVGSAIEHHAVLEPIEARGGRLIAVDARGVIDPVALAALLDEIAAAGLTVSLVSVMAVNNEVGTIQPIAKLAKQVRRHAPDALIHTDAIQALPWLDVAALTAPADLVSISAHKFGGPKGVGALVVRDRARQHLSPRSVGGGQERELRSGTPNVAGIVGMATAARLTAGSRSATIERVAKLRDRLADGLAASVPDLVESGVVRGRDTAALADDGMADSGPDRLHKIAGNCHVCIDGIDSESLLFLLEKADVFASAASSCASGAMESSHVLNAMGISPERARGSLRLSLGEASTDADVDQALAAIPAAVVRLRSFGSTR